MLVKISIPFKITVNVNYIGILLNKLASASLSSKYGHVRFQKTKKATAKLEALKR